MKKLSVFLLCLLLFALIPFVPITRADVTTTRSFSSSLSDGFIAVSSPSYNTAHDAVSGVAVSDGDVEVGQWYSAVPTPFYTVMRGFVFFDTSSIPELATIDSAILSVSITENKSDTDFNLTIRSGGTVYPHNPLQNSDYYYNYYSGDGGSRNTSEITSTGFWNISLSSTGLTWISKTETTKLTLLSSQDIANSAPSGDEYIIFYGRENGESYAAKLYVTYTVNSANFYTYNFHGPFLDTGSVSPDVVNVTVYPNYNVTESFLLNGIGGADTVTVYCEQQAVYAKWNITDVSNETRVYYFTSALTEDIYIFIPNPDVPTGLYTFSVIDFAGLTNAFLETRLYYDGATRTVERRSIDSVNALPFYLQWALHYDLRVVSDEGAYSFGSFTPLNVQDQTLIIPNDAFPYDYQGLNATVSAVRVNATRIQIQYEDNALVTTWVYVEISHLTSRNYVVDYTNNETVAPNDVTVNWDSALEATDYLVEVTVMRDGEELVFSFSCPWNEENPNPWVPLNDLGDNFPFPPEYIPGFILVLMVACIFSYAHVIAGAFAMLIMAAFLNYIHWLNVGWTVISLAGAVLVMVAISKFKETEREV